MHWQYSPYAPPLLLSAAVSLYLALQAWRRRPARGALPISLLMLGVLESSLAYVMELVSADPAAMVFWAKVQYLGFLSLPALWLAFALEYTGRSWWLTRRNVALLTIEPLLTLLILWTNGLHGWFYLDVRLDTSGPTTLLALTYGPYFWIQGAYTYLVVLAATSLIFREFIQQNRVYRRQTLAVLVGAVVPWIANAAYLLHLSPLPRLHLTSFAFTLSGAVLVWALFRYRLLDLLPVARAALIEGMEDGVIVLDAQERVLDFNQAARPLINRALANPIGRPAEQVLIGWPATAGQHRGREGACSELALAGDGGTRYYDLRSSPLFGHAAQLTGRLLVLRDISDRKRAEQAEQEQRVLAEALRDAAASLASTLDLDGVLDRILAAAARVVPYDRGDVLLIEGDLARSVRVQDHSGVGPPEAGLGTPLKIAETADLSHMQATGQAVVIPDTRRDPAWVVMGHTTWAGSYVGAPIRVKGKTAGFLGLTSRTPGFFSTVHAQHLQAFADDAAVALENARLYSSLEGTNQRLQVALRARDEMVQNVSHELRAPLTLLFAHLELLGEGVMGPLNELQQQSLEVLQAQTARLQLMVERLLVLQSFHPGQLRPTELDVAGWLERTADDWNTRNPQTHVVLQVQAPDPLPLVSADERFLHQVLDNLLENAAKFSPLGSPVEVQAHAEAGRVVIAVRDQGIGIPVDKLGQVFERFYQVNGGITRPFGGMGIGLSLCQRIVAAHDGRIWAESAGEGRGSAFCLSLPALPAEGAGEAAARLA